MKLVPIAAAACLVALGGCASLQSLFSGAASAPEANSVAAAANLYTAAAKTADAVVKSAACDQACRDKIAALSAGVRADLDDALTAEQDGDSAKLTLALDAFNQAYPAFAATLASQGATP